LRKEDFYDVYDYGDNLDHGATLKIERSVTMDFNAPDLTPFTNTDIKELESLRKISVAAEQEIFDSLNVPLSKWERQAALTKLIDRAIDYLKTPQIEHTGNKWVKDRYADEKISNRVYQMSVSVYEDCTYDRQTQQRIPTAWYVTWDVGVHTPKQGWGKAIAGQRQKRYTDKEAALKYIEGRKKAYTHLFTEVSPSIPQEYAELFKVNGVLLPGYTIEGQEPITTTRTAKEVLNELSGGAFSFPDKKPSVLGKLAANKEDAKKAPTAGAKKKEEPAL
jgi:hypothetical protein